MATATAPQTTSLQVRRTFAASREKVFRAWTDPQTLKQWFGPPGFKTTVADVDLRVGGKFRLTLQKPTGEVVSAFGTFREIRPSERLVCSWNWDYNDIGDTILTLEFNDIGGETELVVRLAELNDTVGRLAEPRRVLRDGVEHWLNVRRRTGDDSQDFTCGSLLLQ